MVTNIKESGPWYSNWALLLGIFSYNPYEIAIMGNDAMKKNLKMQSYYMPSSLFLGGEKENLPLLKGKLIENSTLIYVCKNKMCNLPVNSVAEALEQLK